MKRDINLCREILISCEDVESIVFDGDPKFDYHVNLLEQGGFLTLTRSISRDPTFKVELTMAGLDILDLIRSDEKWEDICGTIKSMNFPVTFPMVKLVIEKEA